MSIILASQSPRRRELLAQMGVPQFEVVPALGEEIASPGLSPAQLVEVLSRQKAEEVAVQAGPDDVVIAADTVVGELKNNFVQVGKENGVTQYQIEIAQNQVPSLVNAGLSLFAYSVDASNRENYTVNFADYSATVIHNYESTTGETLPEEFKDGYSNGYDDAWYETYGDLLDKVEEVNATNWEDKYYNVLNEQGGGIVYVNTDGSYDYYADYDAFAAAHPEAVGDSLESYVGQDLNLEKVLCTFSVDDQGRLTDNHIEVTFQTTEKDGSSHTLVLTGDVTLTNYGTTTIQPLDVGDRTLITY